MPSDVNILVVGAGISGIRAALDLAELGYRVGLIEKAPAIGGIVAQLDHQFPNNHCGMCRMLPMIDRDEGPQFCLRRGLFHENIDLFLSTEVVSVEGPPGNLTVGIRKGAKGVDPLRCTGCRICEAQCPVEVSDGFNAGLSRRKAIYLPLPHQGPNARVIDWESCTRCGACKEACPSGAVDLNGEPEEVLLDHVGAVILSTGVELFDPATLDLYGVGRLPNVVTATAFERIMSSSGPYRGRLLRPSDAAAAKRIAWVQCVGSRNLAIGADYCSSACCMFAVKEAVLASERIGRDARTTIFYMDMRTFGRDFERYRARAEREHGVRFVRCRIHSIEPAEKEGDLNIGYVDAAGRLVQETFDMVVLSTGRGPKRAPLPFAGQAGVHVVDSALALMDISGSVIAASAVSGAVTLALHQSGAAPPRRKAESCATPEVAAAPPHLEVVLCSCGGALDQALSWEGMEEALGGLPGRVDVARVAAVCDQAGWDEVKEVLRSGPANRLLLAACNPLVHLQRLKGLETELGIPRSFMEVMDLRGLAARGADPAHATGEALREIEMGIGRLVSRRVVEPKVRPVERSALVCGAGPAGLAATLALASCDIPVTLVEKGDHVGGNLANVRDASSRGSIERLAGEVKGHPLVSVRYESEVIESSGIPGQFVSRIRNRKGAEESIHHGVAILATGGRAAETKAYGYGGSEKIVTVSELEGFLDARGPSADPIGTAVFIQCVDSREGPRNYCSRICCLKSLRAAIRIVDLHPDAEVYVFYRDIMTYGDSETVYSEARRKGVMFIPFGLETKPRVSVASGKVVVEGEDPVLREPVRFEPDILALATGVIPGPAGDLIAVFGVDVTEDGFIKEADSKWRPVDTGREGVFVCGLARAPARVDEAVKEGEAAAQRALRILFRDAIPSPGQVARVRHAICSLCEQCVELCPYGARYVDTELGRIIVDHVACQGCGVCATACPNSATIIGDFEETGVMEALDAAL